MHSPAFCQSSGWLPAKLKAEYRVSIGEVWRWGGDEYDHLQSLTCPILIRPHQLIEFLNRNRALAHRICQIPEIIDQASGAICVGPSTWKGIRALAQAIENKQKPEAR